MLLVLGPHRSGTSLTARLLECLGAVNSTNLNPPNEFNPKGYFEDLDIYLFNENVLMPALHTSWHAISQVDWRLLPGSERKNLLERAIALIRKNYDTTNALSVLKEPRISQLLPFWLEALNRAGFATRAVCPVRDALSAARSIASRDNLPLAVGLLVYFRSWNAVLRHLGDLPAVYFDFEEIFTDASTTIANISRALDVPLPPDFASRIDSFTQTHLDSGLVHNKREVSDSGVPPHGPVKIAEGLYLLLAQCCKTQQSNAARQYCEAASADLEQLECYLGALDELAEKQVMRENAARHLRSGTVPPPPEPSRP